jgi:hypothetical protein
MNMNLITPIAVEDLIVTRTQGINVMKSALLISRKVRLSRIYLLRRSVECNLINEDSSFEV